MSVFKRGKTWTYEFEFRGQRIKESSHSRSKAVAQEAERKRRRELEESYNGLSKRIAPKAFRLAVDQWLLLKAHTLAPRSIAIENANLKHILPELGRLLVTDIHAETIAHYQRTRLREGAAPKTINLEVGTIRAVLRRNKVWANIQQDVRMLPVSEEFGRAITAAEESQLRSQCLKSRSRSLYTIVVLTLNTGLRYSDVRLLRWNQLASDRSSVRVGKSKTQYSSGRVIPLNAEAMRTLKEWAEQFPQREPNDYAFPYERYGASGDKFDACAYHTDPSRPIGSFKKAWEAARNKARVNCRFHDLRHTACTRMLEGGAPFAVVSSIMGWSPATSIRMIKKYGHIGQDAQRHAVNLISKLTVEMTAAPETSPKQ